MLLRFTTCPQLRMPTGMQESNSGIAHLITSGAIPTSLHCTADHPPLAEELDAAAAAAQTANAQVKEDVIVLLGRDIIVPCQSHEQ